MPDGLLMILHMTVPEIVLRRGKQVCALYNQGYDPIGKTPGTGARCPDTMSDGALTSDRYVSAVARDRRALQVWARVAIVGLATVMTGGVFIWLWTGGRGGGSPKRCQPTSLGGRSQSRKSPLRPPSQRPIPYRPCATGYLADIGARHE
ncbi:MAG TPA: hypothetical protein VMB73_20195 [Acetobacteraceae bacterium]|jgi:hypothetical protein|nr:hypothetical protein [Acetobacteraceae bacterium]